MVARRTVVCLALVVGGLALLALAQRSTTPVSATPGTVSPTPTPGPGPKPPVGASPNAPAGIPTTAGVGALLRSIVVTPAPTCSYYVPGVAFDGSELLVSCVNSNLITRVRPSDGAKLGEIVIAPGPSQAMLPIAGLSWDPIGQQLWVVSGYYQTSQKVYSVTLDKQHNVGWATYRFTHQPEQSPVVGLDFDRTDGTIWLAPVDHTMVYHYTAGGTLLGSFSTASFIAPYSASSTQSGVVAAGPNKLYIGTDGASRILGITKSGSNPALFATVPANKRIEDLECDTVTFAPKAALWVKFSFDNQELDAYELPSGECLGPATTISGHVWDASHTGVGGVLITPDAPYQAVTTAADGSYTLSGIPAAATVRLTPSKANYTVGPVQQVTVPFGGKSNVDFTAGSNPSCPLQGLNHKPTATGLILITHGWGGLFNDAVLPWSSVDVSGFINLRDAIIQALQQNGTLADWDVWFYDWRSLAMTGTIGGVGLQPAAFALGSDQAAANGRAVGGCLAPLLSAMNYSRYHMLGHSAGSWLIQEIANRLPSTRDIHLTFLDPYAGIDTGLIQTFGANADWAEQYVNTSDLALYTNSRFRSSMFSFDVTEFGHLYQQDGPARGHGWPVTYYYCSVIRILQAPSAGQSGACTSSGAYLSQFIKGFSLAPEWSHLTLQTLRSGYPGDGCQELRDDGPRICDRGLHDGFETVAYLPHDFLAGVTTSVTGTVTTLAGGLKSVFHIGSPVWFEKTISPDRPVNTIAFDYQFDSSVQAILRVEVDGALVFTADGSVEGTAAHHAGPIALPAVWSPGAAHRVVFRLDGPDGSGASASVSNLTTGYASGGPATLVIGSVPAEMLAGTTFGFSVTMQDIDGQVVAADSSSVVQVSASGGPGSLSCQSAIVSLGIATFSNCSIGQAGSYTLHATVGGTVNESASPSIAVSAPTNPPTARGQVRYTDGIPVVGASLWLGQEHPDGGISIGQLAEADGLGNYVLPGLDDPALPGDYTVFVSYEVFPADAGEFVEDRHPVTLPPGAVGLNFTRNIPATDHLVFSQGPSDARNGQVLGLQPAVVVRRNGAKDVTDNATTVTLTLHAYDGTAALSCAGGLARQVVAGVAQFAGCKVSGTPGWYFLTAAAPSLGETWSNSFHTKASVAPAGHTVYRPSNGYWYTLGAGATWWGMPGDIPVPGDYDGNGSADIAVFRPSNGYWYFQNPFSATWWGMPGDQPLQGDFDGDGKADIAVYRPSNGYWYIINSHDGSITSQWWGVSGDIPVPGDFDGDGKTDIAVLRPSNGYWYIRRSSDSVITSTWWAASGDVPVVGDYDGDGKADIAIYRPSAGDWHILRSRDGYLGTRWGIAGDIPEPGDYDGDGKTDIAVYRPSNGYWFLQSPYSADWWGVAGDIPMPLPYIIRNAYYP